MLGGLEATLEEVRIKHGMLARQIGAPESVRSERDGLLSAISSLRRDCHQQLADLTSRELSACPPWLTDTTPYNSRHALTSRPNRATELSGTRPAWASAASRT